MRKPKKNYCQFNYLLFRKRQGKLKIKLVINFYFLSKYQMIRKEKIKIKLKN
ncbi:MAG: hypothetical protein Q8830_02375 [Candidatus Phytoplasma australasiaticum]|nr:hypothetical protein [Candidatus Phytoplasma australasiaticum]MDV3192262.1 hypothetical protein [Candidatus Phytoplasma australasiaticum]